jgi:hypothetical protein
VIDEMCKNNPEQHVITYLKNRDPIPA